MSARAAQPDPLVVVGASVRGLAASAVRAGLEVHAVDLFGDVDLRAVAASVAVCPPPYPAGLPAAVARLPPAACIYSGGLENHPDVIAAIVRGRPLAGCPPEAVAAVRDPARLAAAVRDAGLLFPETRSDPHGLPPDGSWLRKPRRSAGGHGIVPWQGHQAGGERDGSSARDVVWQRRVPGRAAAVACLLTGGSGRLVGASRQLVGRRWCRAAAFRYCGSIDVDPRAIDPPLAASLERLGSLLADRFGLVGLVGVDLVVDRFGRAHVIEVNPRPTASMELVERATGLSLAAAQLEACGLAGPRPAAGWPRSGTWSKAILFAAGDVPVGDETPATLAAAAGGPCGGWPSLADVPAPRQLIPAGRPVCTLFAHAGSPRQSLLDLRRRVAAVASALRTVATREPGGEEKVF